MREHLQQELQTALGNEYTIDRELPRGGMSRVFLATENALGRKVVIKVLAPELAATLSSERFKREIMLAARLQHPHIVPLLHAGQAGGSLYYTMPFVDGESLRDRMSRDRQMPLADVSRILEEVASALGYAHEQGVVHRDMKPENVLFFHGQAVVLDFGIAKAVSASATDDEVGGRITQRGMSLGTPTYIAPEQAAGDPDLDHRADIYALGVVTYEMLSGHPPFSGRTPQQVMAAHATQRPDPIGRKRHDIPAELAAVVMRCLEKRPADRPTSAMDIARMVAATPMDGTRIVMPGGSAMRIPAWVPWAIAGVATVIALGLALKLARSG
jgi:eukaryotic-like serine/threonine-protein kinase